MFLKTIVYKRTQMCYNSNMKKEEWKCKECKKEMPPNYMLWNEVCVFCWFDTDKWRGKKKKEVVYGI